MKRLLPLLLLPLVALGGAVAADLDERGWHPGQIAQGTGQLLTPVDPVKLELPPAIAQQISRKTLVYYFSPNCGHCQATIPGVVALKDKLGADMDFLGVATSRSTPAELQWFMDEYKVNFNLTIDTPRGFGYAVGASSTPTVLVLEPREDGIYATDGYYPWFNGADLVLQIRQDPANAFDHFEEDRYYGNHACSVCHLEEANSWQLTHHAVAYRTIYQDQRTDDAECVSCHVTGLGEPGGFVMGDHGNPMTDVGCEACHSAAGPHDGKKVDARQACASCHDADHSIGFSLEKGLPHIDHYLASSLSKKEVEARWQALASGQAERPLLAFPDQANLGVQACAECHAEETAAWKTSPHGQAMSSLKKKEARALECVSCHATPKQAGAPPSRVEDYRPKESVGCESCHGPGGEHAADPSAENIVGLGESCPECVIEEVCSRCHTPEWDADWDLHKRLEAQKGHR